MKNLLLITILILLVSCFPEDDPEYCGCFRTDFVAVDGGKLRPDAPPYEVECTETVGLTPIKNTTSFYVINCE